MIRIVTRARLAALEAASESAHAHSTKVQAAADEAASCHVRSVQRLSTALAKARDDAADHQNDAEIVREILTDAEGELADARTTVA
ncbi:hypothetical protein FNJ62_31105, partial [Streptomyces benahoarensis]